MKKAGQCMHLEHDFICSSGSNQNYPCMYRDNCKKCGESFPLTQKMADAWNQTGHLCITEKDLEGTGYAFVGLEIRRVGS